MNLYGQAARFAYDPAVVVAFLDAYTARAAAIGLRPYTTLNAKRLFEDDARIIRRWRSGAIKGVTYHAVSSLLLRYDLKVRHMERWAKLHRRQLVLRGHRRTDT